MENPQSNEYRRINVDNTPDNDLYGTNLSYSFTPDGHEEDDESSRQFKKDFPKVLLTPSTPQTSSPPPTTILERAITSIRGSKRVVSKFISGNRLVDRDGPFFQSKGKMRIHKRINQSDWAAFYYSDLFHSIVDAPTSRILFLVLGSYIFLVALFATSYYTVAVFYDCNMGLENYKQAFIFSLETMATIGYGTRDIFFDDCWVPSITLTIQMCVRLVAEAITIGIIYSRIARPSKRASTIVFSRHAVIRRIRGKLYFMFQLCELRKHQLVEAHVRCYTIRHERDSEGDRIASFQTCAMRLNHPNDELGGMLLLCFPQVIVHEIDSASPLMPPPMWASATRKYVWHPPAMDHCVHRSEDPTGHATEVLYDLDALSHFPGVHRRSANDPLQSPYRRKVSAEKNKTVPYSMSVSPSRSTPTLSTAMKASHVDSIRKESSAASSSQRSKPSAEQSTAEWQEEEKRMVAAYMKDRKIEVLGIVEGMDAATGGVMQSRFSYKFEDIHWDKTFATCVLEDDDGTAIVDFTSFHKLKDAPLDAPYMGDAASLI